jgi:hypothetical protein
MKGCSGTILMSHLQVCLNDGRFEEVLLKKSPEKLLASLPLGISGAVLSNMVVAIGDSWEVEM